MNEKLVLSNRKTDFWITQLQHQTTMDNLSDIENWITCLETEVERFISTVPPAGRTLAQEENYLKRIRKLIRRLNEDMDDHCFQLGGKVVVELDAIFTKKALNDYLKAAEAIGIAAIGIPS